MRKFCVGLLAAAHVGAQVVRSLVPAKHALPETVYGLIELPTCDSRTAGPVITGDFKIAEVGIMRHTARGKAAFPLGGSNLYMFWLLDKAPQQPAPPLAAGYPGGVVRIDFDPPTTGLIRKQRANIDHDGGYSMSGDDLTFKINVGKKVTDQYVETPAGTVHTVNVIDGSTEGGFSLGTVSFAPGSQLARLFGKTKVSGLAFGGQGNYHNTTELITGP